MMITVDKVYAVYNETIKYIGAYEKAKEVFGIPKLESDFLAKAGEGGDSTQEIISGNSLSKYIVIRSALKNDRKRMKDEKEGWTPNEL
ncbi:hypothetical protein [Peptostreptococcus canis]|uniref:Uncharacterized protein n=1 Tax=Peptostreptococcus canis TaxID=1159213 RepID=A0ABR6TJT3_9FIRM|nr:hypothetical protein [Peptostreptococcus canis]MBC2575261.1 hypothetical protein [Peptostreptococcus canis]